MAQTDAQKRATQKYNKKTYDTIKCMVRKDSGIKAEAERKASLRGMSIASYITYLIEKDDLADVPASDMSGDDAYWDIY